MPSRLPVPAYFNRLAPALPAECSGPAAEQRRPPAAGYESVARRDGGLLRLRLVRSDHRASRGRDEERFGLEYDLDVYNIVAVSDFNMGGPLPTQPT
jgi:hypothetical protein